MKPSEAAYSDYLRTRRVDPSAGDDRGYGTLDYVQFWLAGQRREPERPREPEPGA